MRIQRRLVKRRHGNKQYSSPVLQITIPARFHPLFEKLLDWNFDIEVEAHGQIVRLLLTGHKYETLSLLSLDLQLAKERKLEIIMKAVESPELQKQRSSYWGEEPPELLL